MSTTENLTLTGGGVSIQLSDSGTAGLSAERISLGARLLEAAPTIASDLPTDFLAANTINLILGNLSSDIDT